jgi:uncharacterized RDD family membrane protein YckC
MRQANRIERVMAVFFNICLFGIAAIYQDYLPTLLGSYSKDLEIQRAALILPIIVMFIIFLYTQAGFGYILTGLRVQYIGGGRISTKTAFLRSMPALCFFVSLSVVKTGGSSSSIEALFIGMAGLGSILFFLVSVITVFFTEDRSLLDIITKTEVVKAYFVLVPRTPEDMRAEWKRQENQKESLKRTGEKKP